MKQARILISIKLSFLICFFIIQSIKSYGQKETLFPEFDSLPKLNYEDNNINLFLKNNISINFITNSDAYIRYFIKMKINKKGNSSKFEIIDYWHMNCKICEKHIINILKKLPRWRPAYKNGEKHTVILTIIISLDYDAHTIPIPIISNIE